MHPDHQVSNSERKWQFQFGLENRHALLCHPIEQDRVVLAIDLY